MPEVLEPADMGDLDRVAFDSIDQSSEEDNEESSIAEQREFIADNAEVFTSSSSDSVPSGVADGALAVEAVQQGFHQPAAPLPLEAINPGAPAGGAPDVPQGAQPEVLPHDDPAQGGGGDPPVNDPPVNDPPVNDPPPLATEATWAQVRDILQAMQDQANAITAREAAASIASHEADTAYKNSSLWNGRCSIFLGGTALLFAVAAFLMNRFAKSSPAPLPHGAGRAVADAVSGSTTASSGIQLWHDQLPPIPRQAIDNLYAAWLAMANQGELEVFNRMSSFARRFAPHLAVYEHIELLQLVKQVGSPRDQRFIWYESEKMAYITFLADLLNRYGYPTFYRNLACAGVNGKSLPVTVAAGAGQLAIAYVFHSRKLAGG